MDVKPKSIVALNNYCEHSHKIKSREEKFKNCFCEIVNGDFSVTSQIILKETDLSFKE